MRFRLRYQSTDLELPLGAFIIGRSSTCHLALSDPLVSRRHAVLHATRDTVAIEDLGSRNGVTVNGALIQGRQRLNHLDRVLVGTQELVLIHILHATNHQRPTQDQAPHHHHHHHHHQPLPTPDASSFRASHLGEPETHEEDTQRTNAFKLMIGVATKAIALGQYEKAEQLLAPHFATLLENLEQQDPKALVSLTNVTGLVLQLVKGLKRAQWLDWLFKAYTHAERLLDDATIDEVHHLVRHVSYTHFDALRAYLVMLKHASAHFSAAERFQLRRLESLERVMGAG